MKDATNETRLRVVSGAAVNAATVNSADPNWSLERQLTNGYGTDHVDLPRMLYGTMLGAQTGNQAGIVPPSPIDAIDVDQLTRAEPFMPAECGPGSDANRLATSLTLAFPLDLERLRGNPLAGELHLAAITLTDAQTHGYPLLGVVSGDVLNEEAAKVWNLAAKMPLSLNI